MFWWTVSPSAQLLEQTARLQSLSDTLDRLKVNQKCFQIIMSSLKCLLHLFKQAISLQDEVAEHVVTHRPGAQVSSDFATFPCTSFVKVRQVHKMHIFPQCLGLYKCLGLLLSGKRGEERRCCVSRSCDDALRPRAGTSASSGAFKDTVTESSPPSPDLI